MRMEEALDAGPVFATRELVVGEQETAGELLLRLSVLGAEAIAEVLSGFQRFTPLPQDEAAASWARTLRK
jgi:methionyl-tRNA formyltransferase